MKTIIISESAEKRLIEALINEEISGWSDKVDKIKDYLNNHFLRGDQDVPDNYGNASKKCVALGLDTRRQPNGTKYSVFDENGNNSDLFNKLQYRFQNILSDKEDRDELIRQAIKDWYNKKK